MYYLGLSGGFSPQEKDLVPNLSDFFFHDSAACIIGNGVLLAATEEERFNRIKKTTKFPTSAIQACLNKAGIQPREIKGVGHYFRRDFVDQSLGEVYLEHAATPVRYSSDLIMGHLADHFGFDLSQDQLRGVSHHLSHAASCFTRSGMENALVLVMDGRGEEVSGTVYQASREGLEILATYDLAKSLGNFYAYATNLLGYRFGDEYKVMGLAPYGNPKTFRDTFKSLYSLGAQGDYELIYPPIGDHPVAGPFLASGFMPRRKGEKFTQQDADFAAGLQAMLEEIVMHVLTFWQKSTGNANLCFVGGVAQNSSLNGLMVRSGTFREIFIHPASHDAGAAEGAALETARMLGDACPVQPRLRTASFGASLGSTAEIEHKLRLWRTLVKFRRPADIVGATAELLASGAVVGWAQGSSEFGPRALGNRSIVADPRPAENKDKINAMVKKRESYRPFAPVVTAESATEYFSLAGTAANYDFMSFVVDVREEQRGILGAVTHVDGTARVQVIERASNPRFHQLVSCFGQLTGVPVLLNTSFNNNAEPIVQTVEDVLTCFLTTGIDYLVIDDFLVQREDDGAPSVDDLILRFRPVTRLAKTRRMKAGGGLESVYEIYLDYSTGDRAEISSGLFHLLDTIEEDRPLRWYAGPDGLTRQLRDELFEIWQRRFITLLPE